MVGCVGWAIWQLAVIVLFRWSRQCSTSKAETQNTYRAIRLVLYNDCFNTRARVLSVLLDAGFSEEKANAVMMDALKLVEVSCKSLRPKQHMVPRCGQGAGNLVKMAKRLRSDLLAVKLERVF